MLINKISSTILVKSLTKDQSIKLQKINKWLQLPPHYLDLLALLKSYKILKHLNNMEILSTTLGLMY